jgi:hypothetical protein
MNPISLLSAPFSRWFIQRLPFGLSEWKYLHFYYRDWEFNTKFEQFGEYGDIFMEATSVGRTCYIANAEAAYQVFHRRDEFPKDIEYYSRAIYYYAVMNTADLVQEVVRCFGDSVLTVCACFHPSIPGLICVSRPVARHQRKDTKSLALNLISKAGFSVSLPMISASSQRTETDDMPTKHKEEIDITDDEYFSLDFTPPGHSFPFGEALDTVLGHIIFVTVTPLALLHCGTAFMRKLALAYGDVGLYLTELLARERLSPSATLLGTLVHGGGLTEEGTIGNIFIFALAGLETTGTL